MFKPRYRWKLTLAICLAFVTFGVVPTVWAQEIVPVNPTMDYVPQNLGIYDTYYPNFREPDCRVCHGASTAERHHTTEHALGNDCLYCHYTYDDTVPPERDCQVCHTSPSIIPYPGTLGGGGADLDRPHHNSDLAASYQCTACHNPNLLSETYTVPEATYPISSVTPTPGACENCHWPSATPAVKYCTGATHQPCIVTADCPSGQTCTVAPPTPYSVGATYPDQGTIGKMLEEVVEFYNDWNLWKGSPKPTHVTDPADPRYGQFAPQPIEANGPVNMIGIPVWDWWDGTVATGSNNRFGVYIPDKPVYARPGGGAADGTHHNIQGQVAGRCYLCHTQENPDLIYNADRTKPENIRACEHCHDVGTLHNIPEHVCTGGGPGWDPCGTGALAGGYTIGGIREDVVYCQPHYPPGWSWKCVACHGDNMGELTPPVPPTTPTIGLIEPNKGGALCVATPASCVSFGSANIMATLISSPVNPFGTKRDGDEVQMCNFAAGLDCTNDTNWVDVPTYSWTENQIEFIVPAWEMTPGVVYVRVHKENAGNTGWRVFIYRQHPKIAGPPAPLVPASGGYGTALTIHGSGFAIPATPHGEEVYAKDPLDNTYGYSTYVMLSASNDRYRLTHLTPPVSSTQINAVLDNILDVKTGQLITPGYLYQGTWNVTVVTDYFKDDGDGKYNYGKDGLDLNRAKNAEYLEAGNNADKPNSTGGGDIIIHREISDNVPFTVVAPPTINALTPDPVVNANTFTITGESFGTTQGTSYVHIGKDVQYGLPVALRENPGCAVGNHDTVCNSLAEYNANCCTLDETKTVKLQVVSWSNTQITVKLPTIPIYQFKEIIGDGKGDEDGVCETGGILEEFKIDGCDLRAHVQVVVNAATKSNVKFIMIRNVY
jgi:hypothetical protein